MSVEDVAGKIKKYHLHPEGNDAKAIALIALAQEFPVGSELIRKEQNVVEVGYVPPGSDYKAKTAMCMKVDNPESVDKLAGATYKPVVAVRINLDGSETHDIPFADAICKGNYKKVVDEFLKKGGDFKAV
jgi:hypothetical protein